MSDKPKMCEWCDVPGAIFSPCRTYRYLLWRRWGEDATSMRRLEQTTVMFIGLNPSTADETTDDPTIRRCIGYAKDWGFSRMLMCNLFAFRATDPKAMMAADDPIGPDNDRWIRTGVYEAGLTVAAWGNGGTFRERGNAMITGYPNMCHFKMTKQGQPTHPLYLPKSLKPEPIR